MFPWPSHEAVQNLSFPGCTGRMVIWVCATSAQGTMSLVSEICGFPLKSDFLGVNRASLCSQSPAQGAGRRKLAGAPCRHQGSPCTLFAGAHASGFLAAPGGRCWLCALWVLQVRKRRFREVQALLRITQLVRWRGGAWSVPLRDHVSGRRSWPLGAPSSSSGEMWPLHSVAGLEDPTLSAGEDAAVWGEVQALWPASCHRSECCLRGPPAS